MLIKITLSLVWLSVLTIGPPAHGASDRDMIIQAALAYIESQHRPSPQLMSTAIHPKLAKRTFWIGKYGEEYIREADYEVMMRIAETYNKAGDRFRKNPKKEVIILDVDQRVATVKLIADDWFDYMHVVKVNNEWKIINVLWQYKDTTRHQ